MVSQLFTTLYMEFHPRDLVFSYMNANTNFAMTISLDVGKRLHTFKVMGI